ncbi:MAG: zinc metalloprotease, partial [Cytophagales bacterium]|nr:zinc metalloprotease [Cytophagales bacterium]
MLPNTKAIATLSIFFFYLASLSFAQTSAPFVGKSKKNKGLPSDTTFIFNSLRVCFSAEVEKMMREKYPELGTRADFENSIQRVINARKAFRGQSSTSIDTIPVIVHVVHNGDAVGQNENISAAQVYSQFTVLNNDYGRVSGSLGENSLSFSSDSKIRFAPAMVDPNGNNLAEMGIHRVEYSNYSSWNNYSTVETVLKPQTQWDPNQYLNIWVVKFGTTGDLANLLGYAQFPIRSNTGLNDLTTTAGLKTDGVLINYLAFGTTGNISSTYNKGRTTTHEIGHYFGLYHPWGDTTDCAGTDYCDDTPLCSGPNYTCKDTVQCGFNRLISNYMDYSYDYCMNNFTNNQIDRMTAVLASSSRRITLPTSDVRKMAAFTQNAKLIGEGDSVSFTAQSNFNPTQSTFGIYNTSVPYPISTLSGTSITYTFPQSGVYDIGLTATYPTVIRKKLKSQYVGVISKSKALLPITEDFEGANYLTNWIAFNKDTVTNWKITPTNISIDKDSKTVIGSNNLATKALYCNNYEIDYEGTSDALISPLINLTGVSGPTLSFSVAYSTMYDQYDKILYTDSLQILLTTNSGASFIKIWQKGGSDLATTSINYKGFVPGNATNWRTESISLSPYVGIGDFNLAIVNLSGYANNLFLDNISISGIATAAPISNFYSPSKVVCKNRTVQFKDSSLNLPSAWGWTFQGGT